LLNVGFGITSGRLWGGVLNPHETIQPQQNKKGKKKIGRQKKVKKYDIVQ